MSLDKKWSKKSIF